MASIKRAAAVPASVAKRAKLEATVVTGANKQMVQGVIAALDGAGLPEDTCRMLQHACPLALGVPSDQRHQMQHTMVELIGKALDSAQEQLVKKFAETEAVANTVLKGRAEVSQKLKDEEEFFAVKEAKAMQRTEELSDAKAKRVADEATLKERREQQKVGDASAEVLKKKRAGLTQALECFQAVKTQDLPAEELKAKVDVVLAASKDLDLEETLRTTLPRSLAKVRGERGTFDDMVMDELLKVLEAQAADFDGKLAAEAVGVEERARAVAEAEKSLLESKEAEEKASAMAAQTAKERDEQATTVDGQRKVLADFDAGAKGSLTARDDAQSQLENFKSWPMECYTMLRDRASKSAEAATAGA